MPVLKKEVNIFPSDLLDQFSEESGLSEPMEAAESGTSEMGIAPVRDGAGSDALELNDRHWWVMFTCSRQEKALARHLLKERVPFYLPLVSSKNQIRGRCVKSFLPLFPGYVFVYGTPDERVTTLKSNRISATLPVDDQQRLTSDLRQVHQLIECDAPLSVESKIEPGRRVRIRSGAMAGIEGTVARRHGKTRLFIAVNFLETGVSVEIDDYMVETID